MNNVISVTHIARKQLLNIMNINKSKYILFNVEGGGCNGLKYNLQPFSGEPKKRDEMVVLDDLKINICGKSLLYLLGTNIDWKEDYMGNRFVFENPNASSKCGCGTTFSI